MPTILSVSLGLRGPHSIRWRLTLLYSALFAVAGAALLAFTYVLDASTDPSMLGEAAVPPPEPASGVAGAGAPGVASYVAGRLEAMRQEQLDQFLIESGVALGVMTVVSVALGWLMAGRVLAPLRTMTAAARRISAENLHERLAVPGPDDELKAMADTFDAVLGRVEGAFEAQKQFVANASHELRTPLTLQQAIVDVALADPEASAESLRAACLRVRAAGQEQERLIEALLTLARSQRELQRREFVDLAEIVRSLVPGAWTGAGAGPVSAGDLARPRVEAEFNPAPLLGDPQLIERLVVNLVDNAVRHNHLDGEESWVRLWTGFDGGCPVLRIANSGPVIAPGHIPGLFQPFRRLGAERVRKRDGLGLGLSIVAAVAAAHGGTVEAWPRPEGGLSVRVGFPPCAPPRPSPTSAGALEPAATVAEPHGSGDTARAAA